MEIVVQLFVGAFALAFAAYAALGIWFPQMRGTWKGSSAPVSPLSLSGIAVFCGGIGIMVLGCHFLPPRVGLTLLAISLGGFVLGGIGQVMDRRSWAQRSEAADVIDDAGFAEPSPERGDRPAARWRPISVKRDGGLVQGPSGASFQSEGDRWCIVAPVSNRRGARILLPILSIITIPFGIAAYQMLFRPEQVQFRGDPFSFKMVFFGPFLLMLSIFWGTGLMSLGGKVVVRAKGDRGMVFVGIGPFGVYRFFRTTSIRRIRFDKRRVMPEHQYGEKIVLEGTRTILFGAALSRDVRAFVLWCLREVLRKEQPNQRRT